MFLKINHKTPFVLILPLLLMAINRSYATNLHSPPQFVGSSVVGNYPNTPFLYTLPVYGERPMLFEAQQLPPGIKIDKETGILSGRLAQKGRYTFLVTATNADGSCTKEFSIAIGDTLLFAPPMGWNSWNVFAEDINEQLILEIADALISSGMRDIGYQYINLDDFWQADARDSMGRPVADSSKFPNGIAYLADYLHKRGLKLGIYSCAGKMTCGERFGGYNYEEIDAKTYAEWGVDLLKYDYCYAPYAKNKAIQRYTKMGKALKQQNRSIVFSLCEWGLRKPWQWGNESGGHYWRITPDIFDTWEGKHIWHKSTESIVRKAIKKDKYTGVNGWNDLDMLIVGNNGKGKATANNGKYDGMTNIEYESHMKLWCLFKSPLLAGCDLRSMDSFTLKTLTNIDLINIQQDAKSAPVLVLHKQKNVFVFKRALSTQQTVIAIWNSTNKTQQYFTKQLIKKFANSAEKLCTHPGYRNTFLTQLDEYIELQPHETVLIRVELSEE
jgi:alpha-galactosidase